MTIEEFVEEAKAKAERIAIESIRNNDHEAGRSAIHELNKLLSSIQFFRNALINGEDYRRSGLGWEA